MLDSPRGVLPARRQRMVEEILNEHGIVGTQELADLTGVSVVTMRRDLEALAAAGVLERTHGGARLTVTRLEVDEIFATRERLNPVAKRRIGAATVERLREREVVGINDGSTVMQVAHHIVEAGLETMVATNALNVALALLESESVEVTVIGGLLRRVSFGTYSPTEETLGPVRFDTVVLGIAGMDASAGIAMHHPFDMVFAGRLIERAERVIVVADSSKWAVRGHAQLAPWEKVDVLVTDATPPRPLEAGVEVVVADHAGGPHE